VRYAHQSVLLWATSLRNFTLTQSCLILCNFQSLELSGFFVNIFQRGFEFTFQQAWLEIWYVCSPTVIIFASSHVQCSHLFATTNKACAAYCWRVV
jgi:hypothetical protein